MASNAATLVVRVTSDVSQAQAGLGQVTGEASKFERGMAKANKAALLVSTGLVAVGAAAFQQASDLQQASGAVDAVYGKQANAVHELAKSAAENMGLARSEYEQTAAVFGAQLKNMGVAAGELVPTTDKLIGLGADLAATFGGSTQEAVDALGSLMRGERDPIERYGVSIKQADVNARLAAKGQDKLTGAAKKTAETEATLALLYEQTAAAQGQRAREADTAASRQEQAMAKVKNAGAALGAVLLPVVAAIATQMANLAGFVESNATAFTIFAAVAGTTAVAVIAVNAALKAYRATVVAVTAVMRLLNLVMKANPLGLLITGITLAIAGFVLLYRRSSTFRGIVQAVGKAGAAAMGWIVNAVKTVVTWVGGKLVQAWNLVKTVGVAAFRAYTAPARLIISLVSDLVTWLKVKLVAGWNVVKEKGVAALDALIAPVRTVVGWVDSLVSKLKSIRWPSPPKWLSKAAGGLANLVGAGRSSGPSAAPSSAPTATASGRTITASPGGVTIVIQGAVDPVGTARQVDSILRRGRLATGVV